MRMKWKLLHEIKRQKSFEESAARTIQGSFPQLELEEVQGQARVGASRSLFER